MAKFRKKPVVVDAVRFRSGERPHDLDDDVIAGRIRYCEDGTMLVDTLEGVMIARPGDWIIRGVKGELYPCKPGIFAATYEPADAPTSDPLLPGLEYIRNAWTVTRGGTRIAQHDFLFWLDAEIAKRSAPASEGA